MLRDLRNMFQNLSVWDWVIIIGIAAVLGWVATSIYLAPPAEGAEIHSVILAFPQGDQTFTNPHQVPIHITRLKASTDKAVYVARGHGDFLTYCDKPECREDFGPHVVTVPVGGTLGVYTYGAYATIQFWFTKGRN